MTVLVDSVVKVIVHHMYMYYIKAGSQYDAGDMSVTSVVSITGKSILSLDKLYS